jgi:hypothetical protein
MENGIFRQLLDIFNNYKGIGFVSLTYRAANGEVSKRLLNVNALYSKAKEKDLKSIAKGEIEYIPSDKYTKEHWDIAMTKILLSLNKPTPVLSEAQKNAYVYINQHSIKYNFNMQEIYLFAKSVHKTVIVPVQIKEVKSEPITIAKNVIENTYLRTATFRNFKLRNVCGQVKLNGSTIDIDLVTPIEPTLF